MKFNTYLNSRKSNEIWLEMGLFSIYYTIIGIIPDILADARITRKIENQYFNNWLNQFVAK